MSLKDLRNFLMIGVYNYKLENDKDYKNIYIIKPGEETNRGQRIQVENDLKVIKGILNSESHHKNGT